MKIDRTLKIKEKYFNAILKLEKPFELRHKEIPENSIVKLECENGGSLTFRSGKCYEIKFGYSTTGINNGEEALYYNYYINIGFNNKADFTKCVGKEKTTYYAKYYADGFCGQQATRFSCKWFNEFCWDYINKAPTYLIEIAEILEVK